MYEIVPLRQYGQDAACVSPLQGLCMLLRWARQLPALRSPSRFINILDMVITPRGYGFNFEWSQGPDTFAFFTFLQLQLLALILLVRWGQCANACRVLCQSTTYLNTITLCLMHGKL